MPTLNRNTTWAASYVLIVRLSNGKTLHDTFKSLGVTEKQWNKYQQSGRKRLKLPHEVAERFKLLASFIEKDTTHLLTLLKMVEARKQKP